MDFNSLKVGDIDSTLGKTIKEIILCSDTYIVYMDADEIIQWNTDKHNQWGENFGEIQNQVSYWENICNGLFNKKDSYNYKCLLAEAYARMLDEGNDQSAQEIIDQTVFRINKQGKEILRAIYFIKFIYGNSCSCINLCYGAL